MHFKQSMILLFVAVMTSAVMADFEEYDVETLKNMLRAQAQCPNEYSKYAISCQDKFSLDINQCDDKENQSLLRIKNASVENRKKFAQDSDESCRALNLCNDNTDAAEAYNCYALESTKTSDTFSSTYFRATALQTAYNADITTIGHNKTKCYEKCSQDLSDNTNKGMLELQNCMKNGKFTLAPIVTVVPSTTKAPVVTETVAPTVTENREAEA